MARILPRKDVVVVGLGWTGSILPNELTDAGLDVVAIERGPWRDTPTDFPPTYDQDELRYRIRHELFLRPAQSTFTFRNKMDQTALPIRSWGAFMPPNGVGGGGVHWNAETWRFLPSDFVLKSHLTQRYGAEVHPAGLHHSGLGRHLRRSRAALRPVRVSLRHVRHGGKPEGTDPGRRQPVRRAEVAALSHPGAAAALQPYALRQGREGTRLQAVSAAVGQPFASLHQSVGREARPLHLLRILRVVRLRQLFQGKPANDRSSRPHPQAELQGVRHFEVTRINVDSSGKRATGVTFVDTAGQEWEQPADLVILSAYTIFNVQLLLLSGIGKRYDPVKNEGVIGRNYTHQTISDVVGFFDKDKYTFNPFIASGAIGMCIDEFNGDNFDHGPLGFIGGGYMGQVQTNGRPIELSDNVAAGIPAWGAKWKQFIRDHYQSTVFQAPAYTEASIAIATSISISIPPIKTASAVRSFASPWISMTTS